MHSSPVGPAGRFSFPTARKMHQKLFPPTDREMRSRFFPMTSRIHLQETGQGLIMIQHSSVVCSSFSLR